MTTTTICYDTPAYDFVRRYFEIPTLPRDYEYAVEGK